jgi:hypothetical protein
MTSMFARLRERQPEIEATLFRRARSRSATADADTSYLIGLREAVSAVLGYGLAWLEQGKEPSGQIPPGAIEHARRAARKGTSLDTVILGYIAGYRLFAGVVRDEASRGGVSGDGEAQRVLATSLDALLERLATVVAEEYQQELDRVLESTAHHRQQVVQRLLAGDAVDDDASLSLGYDLDDWHLGLIGVGPNASRSLQAIAMSFGCELLRVPCDEQMVWAWLGGHRELCVTDVERLLQPPRPGLSFAIGEPAVGLCGWRQTHEEAQAALRVAFRAPRTITRCADVPIEAALLRDDTSAASLMARYLAPLDGLRMGGCVARETLRAYFDCDGNASSTMHRLGIGSRHTITERIRRIEEVLGRPLRTCYAELEVALRLESLGCCPSAPAETLAPNDSRLNGQLPSTESATLSGLEANAAV